MPNPSTPPPDPLDLYRLAVQHPLAEVAFVEHAWARHHSDADEPLLLREDFAGTCAVAAAWVASDADRQAMAVEIDEPTARWAAQRFDDPDLYIVVDDVMAVDGPAVDVTLALNFSVLIYHDAQSLRAYLEHALKGLNPGGLLIMDLFGGSSSTESSQQRRRIEPDEGGFEPFDYIWEQSGNEAESSRITCKIHFEMAQTQINDAFIYDWRLWSPHQLIEAAMSSGFKDAELWWSEPGSLGRSEPVKGEPDAEEWVGYVVCRASS